MSPLATPTMEDGDELTCYCSAGVTGKQFVKVTAARQTGGSLASGVTDSVTGGNVTAGPAAAGDKVLGVAQYDQTTGNLVGVMRAPKVMPVTSGAAITAGQEVQSDANGHAIPLAAGKAAGLALDSCASGADAEIALYP